mgnify:CR=1 FL=1
MRLLETPRTASYAAKKQVRSAKHASRRKEAAAFDKDVLDHASKHGRRCICLSCFTRGFTPRDVKSYRCSECAEKDHMKFDREALDHYKARGRRGALVCTDCTARHQAIEGKLRDKRSLRCTCKGKQKDRVHDFSNEKCDLYPRHVGDQRWPESNKEVTLEDYKFSERMRKRQKS